MTRFRLGDIVTVQGNEGYKGVIFEVGKHKSWVHFFKTSRDVQMSNALLKPVTLTKEDCEFQPSGVVHEKRNNRVAGCIKHIEKQYGIDDTEIALWLGVRRENVNRWKNGNRTPKNEQRIYQGLEILEECKRMTNDLQYCRVTDAHVWRRDALDLSQALDCYFDWRECR